jgi:two-component system response regulator PilR (NtrC family)
MASSTPTALIIDDEPDQLSLLAMSLKRMGVDSIKTPDVKAALKALDHNKIDLCFTDLRLPDGSGLEVVRYVQKHHPDVPIAVITAFGEPSTAVQALKSGAFDYVSKPIEVLELQAMVTTALRLMPTESSVEAIHSNRVLLGQSKPIEKIRQLVSRVARTQAPVLISGETGTGKELIARLIHDNGPRSGQSFIAVNCGAIPRELMESEFFGHRKGSFTGAHQDSDGLFKAAHGGTLFLDEVAELPTDLQVKLLRAIQEKKIRAVGDAQETPIDVRLISATHRNLERRIESGEFREDFYYRINVIPIVAPPLRKRPEDIPGLVQSIVNRLAAEGDFTPPEVSSDAVEILTGYNFPGNVRELENILERTLALSDSETIEASDITLPDKSFDSELSDLPIDEHIMHVEIERITAALAETNGNITEAAKVLGTTFRSLRYKIKKLEIEAP